MSPTELTETCRPDLARGYPCVVVAGAQIDQRLRLCLESTLAHTPIDIAVVVASPGPADGLYELIEDCADQQHRVWSASPPREALTSGANGLTAAVVRALSLLAPGDIALMSEPGLVTVGWLDRLKDAAHADTNTATASALSDSGSALGLCDAEQTPEDLTDLAASLVDHTMTLRPRLSVAVGPCIYVRGDALELVGAFDTELALRWAVEVDFAQRCLLAGLAHVAADDVVVAPLSAPHALESDLPAPLKARYPHLSGPLATAASAALPRALEAARRGRSLSVTVDARALNATRTGTQRHILELIGALAAIGSLRLRLVVSADTSASNLELLRSMPQTELLAIESIDDATPRTTVFHRPQQVFGTPDMRLALRLGERIALNQLDLIAYRNPGYHANTLAWHSHRRASRQALAAADRVIVFSGHTRSELLSDELTEAGRIRIVPPGLDHISPKEGRRPAALQESVANPLDGGRTIASFLLCLGTDFRHKNRVFALRLLAALRERHSWEGQLVFAGTHIPHGSSLELERAFLEKHRDLGPSVSDLGAVDEEEKAWLMSHAAAVVYPSVYEGFGLVPFEAALSGVPCIFAPQSSLAEVLPAGAAAIVPWSPLESADRTNVLLTDPAARAQHVASLLAPARSLTWSAAAAEMVEIYEEAVVAPTREASELSRDEVVREHELRELIAAHESRVAQLARERDHARGMYDQLNADVGLGLSLIGPNGSLPEDIQRALLAISARPALSRPLYGAAAGAFRGARSVGGRRRDKQGRDG